ncbi:hypothetical protein ACVWYG_000805 [Pedobacter sp. UYEF25]
MVEGKLQREGEVVHVIVQKCFDLSKMLKGLTDTKKDDLPFLTLSRADEKTPFPQQHKIPQVQPTPANDEEVFYKGRNFK